MGLEINTDGQDPLSGTSNNSETSVQKTKANGGFDPQPTKGDPLYTIDPLPFEAGHKAPETEAE